MIRHLLKHQQQGDIMKVKANPDTAKKNKPGEAYAAEDKAPRKGVKAQDQDEYDSRGSNYDKSVSKSKAYGSQDKAPTGRGNRGPSQADGGPIDGWDKSVEPYGAHAAQHKAPPKGSSKCDPTSLGFKTGDGHAYLGHFTNEKFLRMGHNDVPDKGTDSSAVPDDGGPMGSNYVPPSRRNKPTPSPSPDSRSMQQIGTDFFNRAKDGKVKP